MAELVAGLRVTLHISSTILLTIDVIGRGDVLLRPVQTESAWAVGPFWRSAGPAVLVLLGQARLSFHFMRASKIMQMQVDFKHTRRLN